MTNLLLSAFLVLVVSPHAIAAVAKEVNAHADDPVLLAAPVAAEETAHWLPAHSPHPFLPVRLCPPAQHEIRALAHSYALPTCKQTHVHPVRTAHIIVNSQSTYNQHLTNHNNGTLNTPTPRDNRHRTSNDHRERHQSTVANRLTSQPLYHHHYILNQPTHKSPQTFHQRRDTTTPSVTTQLTN